MDNVTLESTFGVIIQFPDLTEICSLQGDEDLTTTQTEFVFWLSAQDLGMAKPLTRGYTSYAYEKALATGMRPVSTMNNWWPTHNGETRPQTLYWYKAPEPILAEKNLVARKKWSYYGENQSHIVDRYTKIRKHLAASGCSFKIGEPPFKVELFDRYFTLMRLPLEITPIRKRWLEAHNYRFLDSGSIAQYWINGWVSDTWDAEKEYAHFKTTKQEWKDTGMEGYR